ncbi:alanine--tRNA ligase [Candidatus Zixiibacteriota bacterium]
MTGNEIRRAFLDFFVDHGHLEVASSPVVPAEDPTLLFTNAGMNQFKQVFTGQETRQYLRAASAQKCIRVSGKHNDLENVGRTPRHHTFFEMMGNFSFGDYFKEEAVVLAWEFLCETIGLPKDRLYVTIFTEDDEAEEVWTSSTDIDPDRIYRLGRKDNYWSMGETGPQGPCSEILFDLAPTGDTNPNTVDPTDGDRLLEIWNLVFMQYDALPSGEIVPLPGPSIDTGLGLERLASVMQGVESNYETDLVLPLIEEVISISGIDYDPGESGFSHRVIADHIRGLTFAIADGVIPSNEGRGYVLRRLLRRAARHGRKLEMREPFIHKLVPEVVNIFKDAYPEVAMAADRVMLVVKTEEERFGETLDQGIQRFEELARSVEANGDVAIPGRDAFILYDTFGFPLDLTEVMAMERGLPVDVEGFQESLKEQKERSRADRAEKSGSLDEEALGAAEIIRPEHGRIFVGYERDNWEYDTKVVAIFDQEFKQVVRLDQGESGYLVLAETPFYVEAGGQAADSGEIRGEASSFRVERMHRFGGVIFHSGTVSAGAFGPGPVVAAIDVVRRERIMRNHTATHLLHAALREVLGDHVQQSGSLVEQDRLRFDFSHFTSMSMDEQAEVERWVNRAIQADVAIEVREMPQQEALAEGALAFFGDKYGDVVRVVDAPGWAKEFCGGTHISRTGEIGFFRLTQEGSISSGVRRIEAITAQDAVESTIREHQTLLKLREVFGGAGDADILEHAEQLVRENKSLRKATEKDAVQRGVDQVDELMEKATEIEGVPVVVGRVEAADIGMMRNLADVLRNKLGRGVGVLGMELDEKVVLLCVVSDDLVEEGWLAGSIVNSVAEITGGKGGGRPHLAQAGGPDTVKLDEALGSVPEIIRSHATR